MKNLTKTVVAIYVVIMCFAVACKKDEPTPTPIITTPTTTIPAVKSVAKDITKFSFAALSPTVDATIDASTKAITATVPAGTDVTKLVPTITISDKATISPATGVAHDFSKEVSYTVTAEDGGTAVWKVNVKKVAVVASNCRITTFSIKNDFGTSTHTYEFDTQKRLAKVTFVRTDSPGNNRTTTFKYDNDGFLLEKNEETTTSISKTLYSYNNSRLAKEQVTFTSNNQTPKSGSTTYEYEDVNSNKLKKIVDISFTNTGNVTYDFKDGILVAKTWPGYSTYIVENGLVTTNTSPDGKVIDKYIYDKDGQLVKRTQLFGSTTPSVTTEVVYEYSIIKNKYYDLNRIINTEQGGYLYLTAGNDTVYGLNGFKGFPEEYFANGKQVYVLKRTALSNNSVNQNQEINEFSFTTDANGNITSLSRTRTQKDSKNSIVSKLDGTLTYNCN